MIQLTQNLRPGKTLLMGSRKRLWKLYHQLFVVSPSLSALCWPFSHARVGGPCAIAAQLVAMPLAAQELQLGDGECTRSGECRPFAIQKSRIP